MATENPGQIVSREAGSNVTEKRFVVEVGGNVVNRAGAGVAVDGVARRTAPAGDEVAVQRGGDVIAEAGAAIAAGKTEVMSDADGKAITFAAGGGNVAVGYLTNDSSAAADGDEVTVHLYETGQHV